MKDVATLERALIDALKVVADLTELIKQAHHPVLTAEQQSEAAPGAMTVAQFCERYNLNRKTLWMLRKAGQGPEILQVGRKILITHDAARLWSQHKTR